MAALKHTTPDALRIGRRALEGISGIVILHDWQWMEITSTWVLTLQLSLQYPVGHGLPHLPPQTNWCIVADEEYPAAAPRIYPAKEGGISATFPHQSNNGYGLDKVPWRTGNLCLERSIRSLGRAHLDDEPRSAHFRLLWRCQRALEWLGAADANQLSLLGDPWEMPDFPTQPVNTEIQRLVFCEGPESFRFWKNCPERCGLAEIAAWRNSPNGRNHVFVHSFLSHSNSGDKEIWRPHWGHRLNRISQEIVASNKRKKRSKKHETLGLERIPWIRLDQCPIIAPWAAPATWRDLKSAVADQGLDIYELLLTAVPSLRDNQRHVSLIGFPIPQQVGGEAERMHWQALFLPPFSPTPKGFRANPKKSVSLYDRTHALRGTVDLDWIQSENWHGDQIATRGRFDVLLRDQYILLIGAGALGSALAELLVRAGVTRMTIIDDDILLPGNLARHILTVEDIDSFKAQQLATRLNSASPLARIDSIAGAFPPRSDKLRNLVRDATLVLDTTGDDDVITALSDFPWDKSTLFVSCSLGWRAQILWLFAMRAKRFSSEVFHNHINSELGKQREKWGVEMADENAPREGLGCWHPVFPARLDDIWLMAALATKQLEKLAQQPLVTPSLNVWEQGENNVSHRQIS